MTQEAKENLIGIIGIVIIMSLSGAVGYSIARLTVSKWLEMPTKHKVKVVYEPQYHETFVMLNEYGKLEPTQDVVLYVMSELGVEHKHIAYAQMLLESGHFGSRLAKTNHNYFGMKEPCVRPTTSLGKKSGYASYKSWTWSIMDYALWQRNMACGLSEDEYLEFLGKIYAEDERYVEKIKSISENLI
jgi:hypothetical protein